MTETINQMYNWIKLYYPDMKYVILIIISMGYICVCKKEHRKSIIYPIIVILVFVLNPIIYQKLLKNMSYWRMFWMIPDAIIISYAITDIIKKCKALWSKVILILACMGMIIFFGKNVYNRDVFDIIKNPQKVSADTETVCEAILAIDKHPRCIMPDGMYVEARQYNGDIELMYGRNADGYINELDDRYMNVHYQMQSETPNYDYVFSVAREDEYSYVVCNKNKPVSDDILQMYGYSSCIDVGNYWVYYISR